MIINSQAYPRAALIGNPSDGYYGKTIAFVFSNYSAKVQLYETPELEIKSYVRDHTIFKSIEHLHDDVIAYGYYGGIRLLKASIKRFYDYCRSEGHKLHDRNFTIRYSSNIPNRVGLAGSSAIIIAGMRALMAFYDINIPKPILANLVLSVENEELHITAGLQDRVAQAFEQPIYMNFDKEIMDKQGYGDYQPIDMNLFPPIYIAYQTDLSQGSEVLHSNFRERFLKGDMAVHQAIRTWAELTESLKYDLDTNNIDQVSSYLNHNFDLRRQVMPISQGNIRMVELARSVGASAKFTGSGGAIIGTYTNDSMFAELCKRMAEYKIEVLKPQIVNHHE